jgi:hypothetical protein
MKSGNFNFLEISGLLQACNRTDLPITLPPSYAVVMKSGNFNFLENSGLLQACNRTDLPITLPPSYDVMKSGNFNFLETSGLLQACNRTDLSFFTLSADISEKMLPHSSALNSHCAQPHDQN